VLLWHREQVGVCPGPLSGFRLRLIPQVKWLHLTTVYSKGEITRYSEILRVSEFTVSHTPWTIVGIHRTVSCKTWQMFYLVEHFPGQLAYTTAVKH